MRILHISPHWTHQNPVDNNSIAQCGPSVGQSTAAQCVVLTTRRIMCGKNVNDGTEQLGVCSLMWVMSVMYIMYTVYDRWKSPRFQCAGEILDGWAGAALTAASAGQPSLRCCRSRILSTGYRIPLHNTTVAKLVNWMVARWLFLCVFGRLRTPSL